MSNQSRDAEAIFFIIRRFRIFKLATTVEVKCNNNIISGQVTMCAKFPTLVTATIFHVCAAIIVINRAMSTPSLREIMGVIYHQYCHGIRVRGQQWSRCGYGRLLLNLLWLLHVQASGTAK